MEALTQWFYDPQDIERHHAALTDRGFGGEATRAFGVLATLFGDLELADAGRLGSLSSRNHTRRVIDPDGIEAVLKLTVVPAGDEVGALLAWQRAGLAGSLTPPVLGWGVTLEGWQWCVQRMLPGTPCRPEDAAGLLDVVMELAPRLQVGDPQLPSSLNVLDANLNRVMAESSHDAASAAMQIREALGDLGEPDRVIHGDLRAENLLVQPDRVRVVGPAGLFGFHASDVAQFLARSTSGPVASKLRLTAGRGMLDEVQLATLAAAELVTLASLGEDSELLGRGRQDLIDDALECLRKAGL